MNFIHEQSCCYTDATTKVAHEYLSTPHGEPLWIDPSLTSSRDFSPQHLPPPYPASHAMKDIISSATAYMFLSPFVTFTSFPKPSPIPLYPYYGVISRSKLQNSPITVRKPLWILKSITSCKSFIPSLSLLPLPTHLIQNQNLNFTLLEKLQQRAGTVVIHVGAISVHEGYMRGMDLADTNYKFMDLGMNFWSSWT